MPGKSAISLVLGSNGLLKRGPVVFCHLYYLFPKPAPFPSGQSSSEAPFACYGHGLVPGLNVAHFNSLHSDLLVKMRLVINTAGTEALHNSPVGRICGNRGLTVSSEGGGPLCWD